MDDIIDIPMLLAKSFVTLLLLFAIYLFLANTDSYLLIVRCLGLGFLLISSSIILIRIYKSLDIKTIGIAAAAAVANIIFFYSMTDGNLCIIILRNFSNQAGSVFLIANTLFWLTFSISSLYELTRPPEKKRSKFWKTAGIFGVLNISLVFAFSLIREL
ncbi:MAG: hypothetical protein IPG59_01240 [Candidatus Melainabacteria bacterium]|nr:MAG: hypothetical protein IPG59_01240 [Candidatus Melainabacteria bacterium]